MAKRAKKPRTNMEKVSRGMAARHDLTLLDEAFDGVRDGYMAEWLDTAPADSAKREQIYNQVRAIAAARNVLVAMINEGEFARGEIELAQAMNGQSPVV